MNSNIIYKLSFFLTMMICFSVIISQAISFPDTDGDGITDKLEIYAGLNPKEDECQPRKCRGISIQGSINGEYLILVFGQNLSMKEKGFNGESKLESIKSVVKEHIQYSPNFIKIGAYTYGKQGCSLDEIQSPFKSGSKSNLIKEIESFYPSGSSSIALSLDRLSEELKDKNGKFNILVIGDGSDTCEGNISQSLQNLLGLNTFQRGIKVFFAGVNLSPEKSIELGKIFDSPQSKFVAVNSNGDLKKIFDHPIKEVINSLRGMVCIQVELDDLIRCESNKINQLKRISLKKLSNPIDKDFSMEEKDYLLQQIPVVETKSKIKLKTYDQFKKDSTGNYQKKIIELSKIINSDSRQE